MAAADLDRKILDASADLIAERGVRNVSFREVARRAGVSHQMPYHIFKNLQGILTALAREGFSTLAAQMNAAADAESDAGDRLTAAGFAYVDFACSHVGHFRVMFQRALVDVHDP
ncbi:MAG: TetR/AcrR family transcriptional regulator, partial [Myxococcota bacterium]